MFTSLSWTVIVSKHIQDSEIPDKNRPVSHHFQIQWTITCNIFKHLGKLREHTLEILD